MDVRLPNGKIISNIPEGISKADLQDKLIRNGLATPEDFAIAPQPSRMDKTIGAIETGANILSGMVAEPVAGLAGAAVGAMPSFTGVQQGDAAKAVESVRSGLTYQPRTEVGQANQQAIGQALAPVGEAMQGAEQYLGDKTFDLTGSPALAAAAQTIPTLATEAVGALAGGALTKAKQAANVNKAITKSAPSIEQLKQASRATYRELDEAGAGVNESAFKNLALKVHQTAKDMGHNVRITGKAQGVLDEFNESIGKVNSISELETLRKIAGNAAKSNEAAEAAIGVAMIDDIDDFFDSLKAGDLIGDNTIAPEKIGPMYKQARDLWGRSRRSEMIQEVIDNAPLQASGEENGIRIGFTQILKNKKKRKFFSPQEIKEMRMVSEGTKGANIAKFIGKYGAGEGKSTNALLSGLGGGVGAGVGSVVAGTPGAIVGGIAVPLIGQVSKSLAKNLTKGNARFADDIIRAGKDSKKIADAYLKYTPKAEQSAQELTELFIAKKIPTGELQKLQQSKVKAISDAAIFAAPVIKQMEDEQEGLTIDVQTGFENKQVETMQDPQSMINQAEQVKRQSIIESANKSVMDKADSIATAYKVPANRNLGIDLGHVASLPPYVGTQLLREANPQTAPINEAIIRLAHGNPENRQAVKMVKNVLQNNGMLLPDSIAGSIQNMVASGIKPEKAVQLATAQKTIKPQEAKKIAELIRGKLSPDVIKDFAPLISSIEALA